MIRKASCKLTFYWLLGTEGCKAGKSIVKRGKIEVKAEKQNIVALYKAQKYKNDKEGMYERR